MIKHTPGLARGQVFVLRKLRQYVEGVILWQDEEIAEDSLDILDTAERILRSNDGSWAPPIDEQGKPTTEEIKAAECDVSDVVDRILRHDYRPWIRAAEEKMGGESEERG